MVELAAEVSIHLIEPSDGRSLQKWAFRFPDVQTISLGRGDDADVRLSDPYVSRIHLEIQWQDDSWWLFARGRNGVFIEGRSVTELKLEHGTRFRLSSVGPTFRFDSESQSVGLQTLNVDTAMLELMPLNRDLVEQEADQISETEYFQQLQEKARRLRQHRTS